MASTDYILRTKSSGDSVASDSSNFLRERRAKQLRQEQSIRSRMNRISSPDSTSLTNRISSPDSTSLTNSYSYNSRTSHTSTISRNSRNSRNRLSSPDSLSAVSTNSSRSMGDTHGTGDGDDHSIESSSLLSMSMSRSSNKNKHKSDKENLRWEKMEVEFAFGLLTSIQDAPRKGLYGKKNKSSRRLLDSAGSSSQSASGGGSVSTGSRGSWTTRTASSSRLLDRSPILRHIIQKAKELSKAAVKHRSGNVIIKAKSPYVISVTRDSSYRPPKDRAGVVRSYVKAVVPIEISDVNVQSLTRSSQIMSKILIRQALIEAVRRKIFEPLVES